MSLFLPARRQALVQLVFVAVTGLICAGLLGAAALVPAPPAVLPLLILAGVGFPMAAAYELPGALAVWRDRAHRLPHPLDEDALDRLLLQLDGLPETEHPLGL
jgi:arginine exporter protein ArgO